MRDTNVLIQAWKKAHSYLRSKSWFADVLELDVSALALESFVNELANDMSMSSKLNGIVDPDPILLSLVPAPKTDENSWEFTDGKWQPGQRTQLYMRPLAHLELKDQVQNVAVLIAVADYVETAQGNPSLPALAARQAGVASYGNRLLCDWLTDTNGRSRAEFTWGNAALYRKFYMDYQQFLQRPREVCSHFNAMRPTGSVLGVVSLVSVRLRELGADTRLEGFSSPLCPGGQYGTSIRPEVDRPVATASREPTT